MKAFGISTGYICKGNASNRAGIEIKKKDKNSDS